MHDRSVAFERQLFLFRPLSLVPLFPRDQVDGLEAGTTETRCEKERRKKNKKKGERVWPPPQAQALPHDVPQKDGSRCGASIDGDGRCFL